MAARCCVRASSERELLGLHSPSALGLVSAPDVGHSNRGVVLSLVVWVRISLLTRDVQHLVICLCVFCVLFCFVFSVGCPLMSLAHVISLFSYAEFYEFVRSMP